MSPPDLAHPGDPGAWGKAGLAFGLTLAAGLLIPRGLGERLLSLLGAGSPPGLERARVARVIDGDTLALEDGRVLRLLGVDAPESVHPDMRGPQPIGPEAADRLRALVEGRWVGLEADGADADHFGRRLRLVWLGRTLVNEQLLREGLARLLIIPPATRHTERLRAAEAAAKREALGLWNLPRPPALPIFGTPGP